ncbi:MAG: hypothetical protein R3C97_17800 [Geminicoccaceae bacterium]
MTSSGRWRISGVDQAKLMAGMRADGVPVPVLVQALRRHVGGQSAAFVHHGATSQDILDTAMILGTDKVRRHLDQRLDVLRQSLRGLARSRIVRLDGGAHTLAARPCRQSSA